MRTCHLSRARIKDERMFHPVRQVAASPGRQTTLFGGVPQLAAPGAKYAVCHIRLHLVYINEL